MDVVVAKGKRPSSCISPYQRVAVCAAPVVRQLEQSAKRPLMLGVQARAHLALATGERGRECVCVCFCV